MNKNIVKATSLAALSLMLLTACSAKTPENIAPPEAVATQSETPEVPSVKPTETAPSSKPSESLKPTQPQTKPVPKPTQSVSANPENEGSSVDVGSVSNNISTYFAEVFANDNLRQKASILLDALPANDVKSHDGLRAKLDNFKAEASMLSSSVSSRGIDVSNPDKIFKGLNETAKAGFVFDKSDLVNIALASDFLNIASVGEIDMADSVSMVNNQTAKVDVSKIKLAGKNLSTNAFGKSTMTFVSENNQWKLLISSFYA